MKLGQALDNLLEGKKLARKGWNGRGMFVVYQKGYPQGIPCNKQTAEAFHIAEGDLFICNPLRLVFPRTPCRYAQDILSVPA